MASKLVEQWLKTVKGEQVIPVLVQDIPQIISDANIDSNTDVNVKNEVVLDSDLGERNVNCLENKSGLEEIVKSIKSESTKTILDHADEHDCKTEEIDKENETLPVLKISVKDGKQIISHVEDNEKKISEESSDKDKSKEKHKSKNKDKSHDRSSSSSKSSKHSSKPSSSDKQKSEHKSSSSSRHSSSKDRSKDKDRHSSSSKSKSESSHRKSNDKSSSSSSKSKDDKNHKQSTEKDKSREKSKDEKNDKSEDKQPPSIQKLGKIPKLSDVKKEKPSISIEVRKPDEPKPKTVKTFHSKFRKHGLEEEVKPPPSRASLLNKKPPPILPPTIPIPKRPSPVHNETPPEKKPKTMEPIEKPGAIKLIAPKPKRKYIYVNVFYLLLTFFIFPGVQYSPDLLVTRSFCISLGSYFVNGKSKTHNLTGSQVFQLLVKYLLPINAEFFDKSFVEY